jgi:hypothetical protein
VQRAQFKMEDLEDDLATILKRKARVQSDLDEAHGELNTLQKQLSKTRDEIDMSRRTLGLYQGQVEFINVIKALPRERLSMLWLLVLCASVACTLGAYSKGSWVLTTLNWIGFCLTWNGFYVKDNRRNTSFAFVVQALTVFLLRSGSE